MNATFRWIFIVGITAVAVAVGLLPRPKPPQQQEEAPVAAPPVAAPKVAPNALQRFPVPSPEPASSSEPLPRLDDSDTALLGSLQRVSDTKRLGEMFIFKNLIRRLVVTIDNLPRAKLPQRNLPTPPLPDTFNVKQQGTDGAHIDPANYRRYDRYVGLIKTLDARQLADLYFHFYPLFQEAYGDLGYTSAYFNDRLITVIDDLLAAPRIDGVIDLVQPAVTYKFADPKLEALSAGQKLMIRIGPDNAERVKAKLRALRRALTARHPPS